MPTGIKHLLAPPVFEGDTEKTRKAWLLNVILLTLLARAVISQFVTTSEPDRPGFFLPFALLLLCMQPVMRIGAVRAASMITVGGFWLALTMSAVEAGGLHSLGFRNYILPVIVAGLLLGRGAALLTAGLSIAAGLAMWFAETRNAIHSPAGDARPLELLVTHSISLLMAAVLVTLATRRIEEALTAARQQLAERQHMESELRTSEERFSKAFNLSPLRMGIIRIKDGVVLDVSERWIRDMGFSRADVLGRPIFELTNWIGDLGPQIRELLDRREPVRDWERTTRTKAGDVRTSLLSAEPIELSGEPCMLWVTRDITEWKRAEIERAALTHDLGERIKELTALHRMARLLQEERPFNQDLLSILVAMLPSAWQHPEVCEAKISYGDAEVHTPGWRKSPWVQSANFVTGAGGKGTIQVAYMEERPPAEEGPFLREERTLIQSLADMLGAYLERKQAEEQIRATSEQLRALMASVRSAKEEEGVRISREIHDELGSALTSLRWDLEELGRSVDAAKERVQGMVGTVDATIDVVRRIASELRPSILDDLGLAAAVEWQAQQFQARTGIRCRCDCVADHLDLDPEQSTAIFRIFQETLTNVLRHARATQIDIILEEEEGEFTLKVRDNGRGIRNEEKTGQYSLGFLGMRERANLIGGKIELAGVEGEGTSVTLRVPLRQVKEA